MKDEELREKMDKDLKEVFNVKSIIDFQFDLLQKAYTKGLETGLKAGRPQWHKVADGDYPDTDRTVLAYSDDVVSGHYPYFAQYYKGFTNAKKNGVDLYWNCWRNNMQRELVEPTVWCEIPTFDKE